MAEWARVRTALTAPYIEIDQLDLLRRPEETVQSLAQFLSIDDDGIKRMEAILSGPRPQGTQEGHYDVVSLAGTNWSPAEQESFVRIAGPEMRRYNYSLDDQYYALSPLAAETAS
ncbi:hypothetical protein [Propylenella binzhouense]|uniref:Sulfotransferase domain-containing protein n=1 Tax=Propylenella binzhouense TaxID=2555902 RepID=A0A964T2F6_9HYPH|nr:hypothetical protein [Propylenella binzhouense]MYZ47064.1 hypothetical protein [Propylenella binzhouense]